MAISKDQNPFKKNFIATFLATIVITRLIVFAIPRSSFIYQDKFHHIYLGIILLGIYAFIKIKPYSQHLLAISLGLIVDQLSAIPFYLSSILNIPIANHSFWHYWSVYSIVSTIILTIISVILLRTYLKIK